MNNFNDFKAPKFNISTIRYDMKYLQCARKRA